MRREDTVVAPLPTFEAPKVRPKWAEHVKTNVYEQQRAIPASPAPRTPTAAPQYAPQPTAPPPPVQGAPPAPAATVAPQGRTQPKGQVLVVFGCRGGAGSTTIAVNVAASMARAGKNVCLVDLDLQLGDVATALDLDPCTS